MNEARDIAFKALDTFKDELAGRFIDLCNGNDFNKLTLEKIYDTIDEIYSEHIHKWSDVGIVDRAPAQKWISVKERLPEAGEDVLAYLGEGIFGICWLLKDGYWETRDSFLYPDDVTHWQPLPEPPKEEGENA